MPVVVPWRENAAWRQVVTLGRRRFVIRAKWSERYGYWSLDILTLQGRILIAGQRVNKGWPLLLRYNDPDLPSGLMIAFDPSDELAITPIGRDSMTDGVRMLHYTRAEIDALAV